MHAPQLNQTVRPEANATQFHPDNTPLSGVTPYVSTNDFGTNCIWRHSDTLTGILILVGKRVEFIYDAN